MERNRDEWLEAAMAQWEVPLLRTCFLLLRDYALAEDAVQQTFLKAWRGYGGFRGECSEKTWLMRIAVHTCRDVQRGKWQRYVDLSVCMENLPPAIQPFEEADDTLARAVLTLPVKQRQVVVLHHYQGFSVQEAAQMMGISRRAAYDRLTKAQNTLRKALEGWYHDE